MTSNMKHDLRRSPWRRMAKLRKEFQRMRSDALASAERSNDSANAEAWNWWTGRADGLKLADDLLRKAMQEATDGK